MNGRLFKVQLLSTHQPTDRNYRPSDGRRRRRQANSLLPQLAVTVSASRDYNFKH